MLLQLDVLLHTYNKLQSKHEIINYQVSIAGTRPEEVDSSHTVLPGVHSDHTCTPSIPCIFSSVSSAVGRTTPPPRPLLRVGVRRGLALVRRILNF